MTAEDDADAIEVVAHRVDFLEALAETPRQKPELVDDLDQSRSTVDRAIRTLEDAGLVERGDDGYVTTLTGRLAADRYRAFLADERDVLAAQDVLGPLPSDCEIPIAVLSSSSASTGEGEFWLFEHVGEHLRSADQYHAILPQLADSRHLRLCQARAERTELTATILLGPAALDRCREEFPRLAVSLAETDGFAAKQGPDHPFGLLLAERADGPTTVVVVTYDDDGVAGVVRNDSETAVAWAREQFETLRADASDATPVLQDVAVTGDVTALTESGQRLSPTLRSQGFARVDAAFLDRRDQPDPETGRRASVGRSEVTGGYAVERDGEDTHISIGEEIHQRLRDGTNVALLGPAGSGKHTVCKQVAIRWHERGDVVLYRESDGQPFVAIGALESAIDSDPGHTLVVVEDAVRSDANAIFDVMQAASARDDVSFLLNAHGGEWHDAEALPIDARLEAFRREHVETVAMPPRDG